MNYFLVMPVYKEGKSYSGGYFYTKEEAFQAATELREKLHGAYARSSQE